MRRISIVAGAVALLAAITLIGCNLFSAGLSVSYNGANIAFGSTYAIPGTVSNPVTITIKNTGSNTLHITGNITATPAGGSVAVSTISQPATTLAINATTTFGINLAASGAFNLAVSIPNDSGQNPFNFTVTGTH